MNISINVSDYLDEERITELCEAQVSRAAKEYLNREMDLTRILSNAAYMTTSQIVNEHLGENADEIIAQKVVEIIDKLSSYTVFRPAEYGNIATLAWQYMDKAVEENKSLIEQRVKNVIAEQGITAIEHMFLEYARAMYCNLDRIADVLEGKPIE